MAKQMIDIGLVAVTAGDDLNIVNGDFQATESTIQHQRQLLLNDKGTFKQNPTICVGMVNYIDDEDGLNNLARAAAKEFSKDGMKVKDMRKMDDGSEGINAYYP